jgi:hypothetical protein
MGLPVIAWAVLTSIKVASIAVRSASVVTIFWVFKFIAASGLGCVFY